MAVATVLYSSEVWTPTKKRLQAYSGCIDDVFAFSGVSYTLQNDKKKKTNKLNVYSINE